jgi:hypothetical protein
MKKTLLISLMSLMVMNASPAFAFCLSPEPITCAITALFISGGVIHDLSHKPSEMMSLQSTQDKSEIESIVQAVRADKALMMRMASYSQYSPGYSDVVRRYQSHHISGRLSLESLRKFDPRLFADLDQISSIIESRVAQSEMPQAKDSWERYALLAAEAQTIYANTFVR